MITAANASRRFVRPKRRPRSSTIGIAVRSLENEGLATPRQKLCDAEHTEPDQIWHREAPMTNERANVAARDGDRDGGNHAVPQQKSGDERIATKSKDGPEWHERHERVPDNLLRQICQRSPRTYL